MQTQGRDYLRCLTMQNLLRQDYAKQRIKYLLSPDAAEENRLLTLLEKAYLESRYGNQLIISNSDIDVLTEAAETLHEKAGGTFTKNISAISGE